MSKGHATESVHGFPKVLMLMLLSTVPHRAGGEEAESKAKQTPVKLKPGRGRREKKN